jgi:hypothetical protein
VVVIDVPLCPDPDETEWYNFGNQTVQFGGRRELVPASVLVSAFASRTLFCSTATSPGLSFVTDFASPSAKDSLLDPVFS